MDRETPTYAGLMLSLIKYRDRLEEDRNFKLNSLAREIDVRIIDKLSATAERMDNAIAYIFERHNLIELKNPTEPLNIDVVWKGISYAAQYKSMGYDKFTKKQGINAIPMRDITLTFLRMSKPYALFTDMKESGYTLEEKFPGVYHVQGMADIKMQIVVGKELKGDEFVPLRVQGRSPSVDDAGSFIKFVNSIKGTHDRELADAIFQLSIAENRELYETLRKERGDMCEAFRDLMKEEIKEALNDAHNTGINTGIAGNSVGRLGYNADNGKLFSPQTYLLADDIIRLVELPCEYVI